MKDGERPPGHTRIGRWLMIISAALVGMGLLVGCSPVRLLNAALDDSAYERRPGLAYGQDPRQKLDIYLPDTAHSASRTVVFVYGGAWRKGDREQYRFVANRLANAGHRVIMPDYRLYPQVQFPAIVQDVVDAIEWVVEHPEASGMPAEAMQSVVLMGHSSGAHTAALLAADAHWLHDSGVQVEALIGVSGPYELPLDNPEVAAVFPAERSSPQALPLEHITDAHPRTLLIHGTDDERVLPAHTRAYARALRNRALQVDLHWLDGTGHAAAIASMAAPLDVLNSTGEVVLGFLEDL